MATSTIKAKAIPFTATILSSATDGTFNGMFYPDSGVVTFTYSIRLSANVDTLTALWTIPADYRPSSSVTYCLFAYISTGNPIAYYGSISTAGAVTQNASQSCRHIIGMGTYKV